MICVNCAHEQESGKFCGKCGAKFEATGTDTEVTAVGTEHAATAEIEQPIATPIEPVEPNVYIENTKQKSKLYFKYFMQHLKQPSLAKKEGETHFTNGLISIGLLALLTGVSISAAISSANIYGTSFFSTLIGMILFSVISMGLVVSTLWLTNKFFGPQQSFKSIVNLYGGHLSPLLIVATASLLLILLKSYTFAGLSLFMVFLFTIMLLPLYLISILLTKKSSNLDPLYGYFIYIIATSISFIILMSILADSTIGRFIDQFNYYF